jgi:hypothetical protein
MLTTLERYRAQVLRQGLQRHDERRGDRPLRLGSALLMLNTRGTTTKNGACRNPTIKRALREADSRRLPGRSFLAHDPPEARELPQGIPRFRCRARSRASMPATSSASWVMPASCATGPRSRRPSRTRRRTCVSTSARVSANISGTSSTASRLSTSDAPCATSRLRARSPRPSRKALKKEGFRFVGPTTVYAFMQSSGFVNDHLVECHRYAPCAALQRKFKAPKK